MWWALLPQLLAAQVAEPDSIHEPVDARFLFHYYDQDGDHSAVTGGIGTQKLEDRSAQLVLHVPIDSTGELNVSGGVNYYTSASTDEISTMSSASDEDIRVEAQVSYIDLRKQRKRLGFLVSGSSETDYSSSSIGLIWGRASSDKNQTFDLLVRLYLDKWMIVLPDELRATRWTDFPTDKRRTILMSLNYTQALTPSSLVAVTFDPQFHFGLLSTPFHRVIANDSAVLTELLPNTRLRLPVGLRYNHNFGGRMILKLLARVYEDSYGIRSLTGSAESIIKLGSIIRVAPAYRYYYQTEATHFFPHMIADPTANFRTSDYDLSEFTSHRIKLSLQIEPENGLVRFNKNSWLSGLGVAYNRYWRTDGLRAWWLSGEVRWLVW